MEIARFDLERWQSIHEHDVEINLSESGMHPLRLRELTDVADREDLLGLELGYSQTNGTVPLRERVATLYDGASAANVLVANGGSEANFVTCWHLIEPGDEVVVVQPTYMQIPGLARSFGATVREVWLEAAFDQTPARWRLDLDAVRAAVTPRTRFIAVCNPNNPTGARLDEAEIAGLCAIAADPRVLGAGRRDLPRRRARRPRHTVGLGSSRPHRRDRRSLESLRAPRVADRLDRRAGRVDRAPLGTT